MDVPVALLGNLQLDGRRGARVVGAREVDALQGRDAAGHDDGADLGVALRGPGERRALRAGDAQAADPAGLQGRVGARVDGCFCPLEAVVKDGRKKGKRER